MEYDELVKHATKLFSFKENDEIGVNYKFFYLDDENDIISISSQADLEEAFHL